MILAKNDLKPKTFSVRGAVLAACRVRVSHLRTRQEDFQAGKSEHKEQETDLGFYCWQLDLYKGKQRKRLERPVTKTPRSRCSGPRFNPWSGDLDPTRSS